MSVMNTWYNKSPIKSLDYSKPIFAMSREGTLHLLLPVIVGGRRGRGGSVDGYKVIGYNWFNLVEGDWSSCVDFPTVEAALREREAYEIYNGKLEVTR